MIDIINNTDGLPISVIVPLQEKRKRFFYQFVLPLIKANNPKEIIINLNDGGASKKRNEGFKISTQPFVSFVDDDILLPNGYFSALHMAISNTNFGYAYTGYIGIVTYPDTNPIKTNFILPTTEYNIDKLLNEGNYISSISLIKRKIFPLWDESLSRFTDYDLYLRLFKNGIIGKAVHGVDFFAFYMDEGMTTINNGDTYQDIVKKHFG